MQLSALTFNIWDAPFWVSCERHERIHRLSSYLKQFDPDVVCLQEAFDMKHRELVHASLGKHLYFTTDRCNHTRRVFFFKRLDLTGGLVIFSKFPILKTRFVPFKKIVLMALAERIGRKGFLEAIIDTPTGKVSVITTHLYSFPSDHASGMRAQQLAQIFDFAKKKHSKFPTMLCGDLNEDKILEKEPFSRLIHRAGFLDSTEYTGETPKPTYRPENPWTNTRFNRTTSPQRLDYILLRNLGVSGLTVASNHVLPQPERPLSDHDPVLVTLKKSTRKKF